LLGDRLVEKAFGLGFAGVLSEPIRKVWTKQGVLDPWAAIIPEER
jgi:hypothetical protein